MKHTILMTIRMWWLWLTESHLTEATTSPTLKDTEYITKTKQNKNIYKYKTKTYINLFIYKRCLRWSRDYRTWSSLLPPDLWSLSMKFPVKPLITMEVWIWTWPRSTATSSPFPTTATNRLSVGGVEKIVVASEGQPWPIWSHVKEDMHMLTDSWKNETIFIIYQSISYHIFIYSKT